MADTQPILAAIVSVIVLLAVASRSWRCRCGCLPIAGRMRQRALRDADPELQPRDLDGPIFIAGMGRAGRTLADALTEFDIAYGAIEADYIAA